VTGRDSDELVTVAEAARRLNVTSNAIYKLISKRKLDSVVVHFYGRTDVNWIRLYRYVLAGKFSTNRNRR
jgi:excisionase family DNA binding protein